MKDSRGRNVVKSISSALMGDDEFLRRAVQVLGDHAYRLASLFDIKQVDLVLDLLEKEPMDVYRNLHRTLAQDERIWRKALQFCPLAAQYMPHHRMSYSDVADAVKRDPRVFCVLGHWTGDKGLALLAVTQQGNLLGNPTVSSYWRCDFEVALAAVKQNGLALEFLCGGLQSNDEIVMEALTQNGLALAYAPLNIRESWKYVKIAAKENPHAISFSLGLGALCEEVLRDHPNASSPSSYVPRHRWDFLI